jgi:hypothetical protein
MVQCTKQNPPSESIRKNWSLASGVEDVLNKLNEKTARVQELEQEISKSEKHHLSQVESLQKKLKNSELQTRLLQANLGDDVAAKLKAEM